MICPREILRHRANEKTIENDAVTSIVLSSGKEMKSSNLQALGLMFEIGNLVSPPIDQLELQGVVMPDVARITQGGDSYRALRSVNRRSDYRDNAVRRLRNLVDALAAAPSLGDYNDDEIAVLCLLFESEKSGVKKLSGPAIAKKLKWQTSEKGKFDNFKDLGLIGSVIKGRSGGYFLTDSGRREAIRLSK